MDLMNDFYKRFNIYAIPAGNTGAQMGGWFRKEIKDAADLNGLKMRSAALPAWSCKSSARSHNRLPAVILSALEKGTIDAAEWSAPTMTRSWFVQVTPYYHYPSCGRLRWSTTSSTSTSGTSFQALTVDLPHRIRARQ